MRKLLVLVALAAIVALTLIQFGPQFVLGDQPIRQSEAPAATR
jgi:hypothetical protein